MSYWVSTPDGPSPFILLSSPPVSIDNQLYFEANPSLPPEGISDMVQMQILNEPEILANLKLRYSQLQIFTFIGPSLLIMNPYREVPGLLSEEKLIEILEKRTVSQPNIYSIAMNSIIQLEHNQRNQAIVISGESGAGKTETTKHCMRFLTFQRKKPEDKSISEKILDCNPILEAFGNAKTVRNDNSSRFGKYVRLLISQKKGNNGGAVQGATISSYLLEKSRVIEQAKSERNFHIFYYLMAGLDPAHRKSFGIEGLTPESLNYLNKSQCYTVGNLNDSDCFHEVMRSFKELGFKSEEIEEILAILVGILLMGNLEFSSERLSDTTPCEVKSREILVRISGLFGVDLKSIERALVWKVREVGKQQILSPLSLKDCEGLRDSVSKNLFEKLFLWLVKKLNLTVFPQEMRASAGTSLREVRKSIKIIRKSMMAGESNRSSVGLLDIFGFENFQVNSLEQLCINFTNEKLQQLYVGYIYKSEENELKAQGFDVGYLDFQDNQPVLDLIEKYPVSVLELLDESTSLKSSTDENLLASLQKSLGANPLFKANIQSGAFQIRHTSKTVAYSIKGFRSKNRDEITKEIEETFSRSGNLVIKEAFFVEKEVAKARKFLAGKFKNQIRELMSELASCDVSFVRCLKPNEEKKAGFLNESFVLLQIRYLGLIDTIRIRQKGYEIRRTYQEFYGKFNDLLVKERKRGLENNLAELKEGIAKYFGETWSLEVAQKLALLGKTKIFLKNAMGKKLEKALQEANKLKAEKLKKIMRQYNIYKFKKNLKFGVKALRMVLRAIIRLQSKRKAVKQRNLFLRKKKSVRLIESIHKHRILKAFLLRFKSQGALSDRLRKKTKAFIKIMEIRKRLWFKEHFLKFARELSEPRELTKRKTVHFNEKKGAQQEETKEIAERPSRKSILKTHRKTHSLNAPLNQNSSEGIERKKTGDNLIDPEFISQPLPQIFLKSTSIHISEGYPSFPDFSVIMDGSCKDLEKASFNYHFDNMLSSKESLMIGNFSSIPRSLDCYLDFAGLDQEFLQNIKNSDFLTKAGEMLQKQRRWFKLVSKDRLLSYQKTPISTSLQKLPEKYVAISLKVFKLILQYSYDLPSSSWLSVKVQKLLSIVQAKPLEPELTDETYLLLIKQLRNNPNSSTVLRLYRLLGLVSSVRPPSLRLMFPVLNFLYNRASEIRESREELECLKYSMSKIIDGFEKGMRKTVPSDNEMALIEFRKTIQVPINFMNGGCLILNVEPYTTVREVILIILKKLEKAELLEFFGLHEVCWRRSMVFSATFLENDVFILDRVNLMERLKGSEDFANATYKPKIKFFLRIRIFYKFSELDFDTIDLLYNQYSSDLASGKYLIEKPEDLCEIMGFSLFIDYGPFSMEKSGKMTLNVERYVPGELLLLKGAKFWFEGLMNRYSQVQEAPVNVIKLRFLALLKGKNLFFAHHFQGTYAEIEGNAEEWVKREREESWIVIKPLIFEVFTTKRQRWVRYEFDKIEKWGRFDEKSLVIYTTDGAIHVVSSSSCVEIEFLIKNYIRIAIKLSSD